MFQAEFLQRPEHHEFSLALKCRWCGHAGTSLWENTASGQRLVDLKGFYERLVRTSCRIETVCGNCDRSQPTALAERAIRSER